MITNKSEFEPEHNSCNNSFSKWDDIDISSIQPNISKDIINSIIKDLAKDYFSEFSPIDAESLSNELGELQIDSDVQDSLNTLCDNSVNNISERSAESFKADILSPSQEVVVTETALSKSFQNNANVDLSNMVHSRLYCPTINLKEISHGIDKSSQDLGYFNVNKIRSDFPILNEKVNGKNLIYFDNAATTQKPRQVIERLKYFYEHENSNVHRAAHELAARTTIAYEGAREKAAQFLNSQKTEEIVFVRGATEGINLIAQTYGLINLKEGDEVIISLLEHHANIVPWQMVCRKTGAKLRTIPVDEDGQIILSEYEKLLSQKTKIVAITHVSNALGTITPVEKIVELAHSYNAKVLVDGAQAVAHLKVDVRKLNCDFYVFSGHKVFGPTGIGVLYGKYELLDEMPPYQGGGNMIEDVTIEKIRYKSPPHRFEAGTGNIADAIGLGTAIDYVTQIGIDSISNYDNKISEYARRQIQRIPNIKLLGNATNRAAILSFVLDDFSTEEIGKALNHEGIAVRTGHHCSQPILREYGLISTIRASFAMYNTLDEIDYFFYTLKNIINS